MTDNPWQYWQDKLDGKDATAYEGHPQCGFYRKTERTAYGGPKTFTPVAFFHDAAGNFLCRVGMRVVGNKDIPGDSTLALETWQQVCDQPVTEKDYRSVADGGGRWSDEHEAVPMQRSNRPPEDDSFEGLQASIDDLAHEAEKRLKGPPIADQAEADRIANLADRLAELWTKADDARKAEKKPHDDAAKAVQVKWAPVLLAAEIYKQLKYKLLTPFLRAQQMASQRAQEEAAAAGQPVPAAKRQRAGTRGRAMSLKSTKRAEIVDYAVALDAVKNHDDVRGAVQHIANQAARSGVAIPGTKIVEEEQVV